MISELDSMALIMIHTRRFPPRGYHAITLFPFVFYNGQPMGECEVRHEVVHLCQQAALLVVGFYFLYFVFWLAGVVFYRDLDRAYREIPFERSAYILENETTLRPLQQAFHWLRCFKNDKK